MVKSQTESINDIINKLDQILYNSADEAFIKKLEKIIRDEGIIDFNTYKAISRKPKCIDSIFDSDNKLQMIYRFVKSIEKADSKKINVLDYFTENEELKYKSFVSEKEDDKWEKELHTFHNVYKKSENQYSMLLSVEQIAWLSHLNMIRVDANYQRQSKIVINPETNEILRKVKVNNTRVEEIGELISDNKYYFDEIKISLMNESDSVLKYDEQSHTLYWEGDCVVPDGNHRRLACMKAYFDNRSELKEQFANQKFNVSFTYTTPRQLKQLMAQTWNTEPIDKKHVRAMQTNISNQIVDEIVRNDDREPLFINGIVSSFEEFKSQQGFIIKSDLADAINRNYKTDNGYEYASKLKQNELVDWIIEFYSFIVSLYTKEFMEFKSYRRKSSLVNKSGMYSLIKLSSLVKDDSDWKVKTKSVCEQIDWSKNNESIKPKIYNNLQIEKIENYVLEVFENAKL